MCVFIYRIKHNCSKLIKKIWLKNLIYIIHSKIFFFNIRRYIYIYIHLYKVLYSITPIYFNTLMSSIFIYWKRDINIFFQIFYCLPFKKKSLLIINNNSTDIKFFLKKKVSGWRIIIIIIMKRKWIIYTYHIWSVRVQYICFFFIFETTASNIDRPGPSSDQPIMTLFLIFVIFICIYV